MFTSRSAPQAGNIAPVWWYLCWLCEFKYGSGGLGRLGTTRISSRNVLIVLVSV